MNIWDDGYPSGGNYWRDYTGVDLYSGPNQNELGSDGIGDTPYLFAPGNRDNYPLMNPYVEFDVAVVNVSPSKTVVPVGDSLPINVTVENHGLFPSTFNLTLNATYIYTPVQMEYKLQANADHTLYKPSLRETIGWLHKENQEAIWILWERSLAPLPHENIQPQQSGLVLLKSDIVEMRRLPLQNIQNKPPLRLKTQDGLPYGCQVGDRIKSGTKNLAKAAEGKEKHGTQ